MATFYTIGGAARGRRPPSPFSPPPPQACDDASRPYPLWVPFPHCQITSGSVTATKIGCWTSDGRVRGVRVATSPLNATTACAVGAGQLTTLTIPAGHAVYQVRATADEWGAVAGLAFGHHLKSNGSNPGVLVCGAPANWRGGEPMMYHGLWLQSVSGEGVERVGERGVARSERPANPSTDRCIDFTPAGSATPLRALQAATFEAVTVRDGTLLSTQALPVVAVAPAAPPAAAPAPAPVVAAPAPAPTTSAPAPAAPVATVAPPLSASAPAPATPVAAVAPPPAAPPAAEPPALAPVALAPAPGLAQAPAPSPAAGRL